MDVVLGVTRDLPEDLRLKDARLAIQVVALPTVTRTVDLRVWIKVPLIDGAAMDFTVERRVPQGEWEAIMGGTALSRTVGGVLPKRDGVPYCGQMIENLPCAPLTEFRFVPGAMTPGAWSYLAEVSGR